MADTTRLKLPELTASQAQKHVTHNEALLLLDLLTGAIPVLDRDLTAPPGGAADGNVYILGGAGTGAWAGFAAKDLALRIDGGWKRVLPAEGMIARIADEAVTVIYSTALWRKFVGLEIAGAPDKATLVDADRLAGLDSAAGDAPIAPLLSRVWTYITGKLATGGNVGIGATAPFAQLEVLETDANAVRGIANRQISDNSAAPLLKFYKARGTVAAPAAVLSGDVIGNFSFGGYDGSAVWDASNDTLGVRFRGQTAENWSATAHGANLLFETVPIGSTIVTERVRITSEGNVGIGAAAPTAKLDVAGAVKVGSYTVATLPSASTNGAGSMIYVSNETGGAVIAFSDGTNWRRVTDRAVVA